MIATAPMQQAPKSYGKIIDMNIHTIHDVVRIKQHKNQTSKACLMLFHSDKEDISDV